MENKSKKNSIEEVKKQRLKNLTPFQKGNSGNPHGRPKGLKNFKTLFFDAITKIALEEGTTPDAIELDIIKKGVIKARQMDYGFYRDLLDRLHGKPTQTIAGDVDNPLIIQNQHSFLKDEEVDKIIQEYKSNNEIIEINETNNTTEDSSVIEDIQ